jgi:hypothetical protein
MMFDPMTVVLWGFTAVSLLVWGRGTFCGWLCPFGALQEAAGKLARWLKVPQVRIRSRTDTRLKLIKYPLLAAILASALLAPDLTDNSAATCARSARRWRCSAGFALSTGFPAASNAARHARPAVTVAITSPSRRPARSATTNASSAWTAWPSTAATRSARHGSWRSSAHERS